jgi:two-component system, NtrC family, response regulator AtoC
METSHLLVVSRDLSGLCPLAAMSDSNSWLLETAANAWEALERMQSGVTPHLLIVDMRRGDQESLHILQWLRRLQPELKTIVVCHPEDADANKDSMRTAAHDIIVRPYKEEHLELAIYRYLARTCNGQRWATTGDGTDAIDADDLFATGNPVMQQLRAQIELLGRADVPVLITGETGTGKRTVAGMIHAISGRAGMHLWKVDAAHASEDLVESGLFTSLGELTDVHHSAKAGSFRQGTILFEELTELSDYLQCQLLDILQRRSFRHAGTGTGFGGEGIRVLATTSANIEQALTQNKLREDLYYRLSAFSVHVPALRQRRQEIPMLLDHFMRRLAIRYRLPQREFSRETIERCKNYSWPGNVDELRAFVKRHLYNSDLEMSPDQSPRISKLKNDSHIRSNELGKAPGDNFSTEVKNKTQSLKSLVQNIKRETERNAIGMALEKTGWNRKAAAQILQISYRALLYKIDEYHVTTAESFMSPLAETQDSVTLKGK